MVGVASGYGVECCVRGEGVVVVRARHDPLYMRDHAQMIGLFTISAIPLIIVDMYTA